MKFITLNPLGRTGGIDPFDVLDGDLVEESIELLVTASLYTWRRARDDDKVPEGKTRMGWFADPDLGSRLWLLDGSDPVKAKEYAEEALAWLITDGIASAVTVAVVRNGAARLDFEIEVTRPRAPAARVRYGWLYQE